MSANHRPIAFSSGPSRRAVVRTAAWAVPVVSVAATAPAFAASPCSTRYSYALTWGSASANYMRTDYRNATASLTSTSSTALGLTFSSVSYSGDAVNNGATSLNQPDQTRNLVVPPKTGTATTQDPVVMSLGGRPGERGLAIYHATSTAGRGNRQEVTITFSRMVRGLAFWITDIDSISNPAYADRVELTAKNAAGGAVTFGVANDGITGAGTSASPWQRAADSNVSEISAGAQTYVTFPTAATAATDIKSITLAYWNNAGGTQYHRVYLGNLSLNALGC